MTSEIKQRIEQIRRGEVPEEYKKIHGDIVPLTWDQISLADCIVPYEEKTSVANQYPVLTSSRKGLMLQTDYYSNRQVTTEDNVGYNIIPFGYITFRSRSDDGRFKFNQNSIIDRGIISYFYPVFILFLPFLMGYLVNSCSSYSITPFIKRCFLTQREPLNKFFH